MFLALQLDRGNISQALSDNMLSDLGLTTNDYNTGQTIFLVVFLCAELPSQLISKKLGPDRWIPTQITLWSLVAISQFQLKGKASFFVTRGLLGLLEGGFIADTVSWLSYFYTSSELPVRLSFFWTTCTLTAIASSIISFGILRLRDVCGLEGWRWLFLIEGMVHCFTSSKQTANCILGIFTFCVGVASFFKMPASPVQTKTWFRPKGWFTEFEEKLIVNRVLRDDPSKGDMHNREPITLKQLGEALCDYDLWPLYVIGIVTYIPVNTVSSYFTLTLKGLGFSTFNTNLLTIPPNIFHMILLLGQTWLAEHLNERSLIGSLQPLWILPCAAVLAFWGDSQVNVWGTYIVLVVFLSSPYIHATLVGWCMRNSNNGSTRTVSAAVYNMFVQGGSIIASNIYRKDDAPLYRRGNTVLFFISILSLFVLISTKLYYLWRNASRERVWSAMTTEQKTYYQLNTNDKGNKRLDFRFVH